MIKSMKSELWFVFSWYAGLKRKGKLPDGYIIYIIYIIYAVLTFFDYTILALFRESSQEGANMAID